MDPDPDPGGPKHTDPDSVPDPQHWFLNIRQTKNPLGNHVALSLYKIGAFCVVSMFTLPVISIGYNAFLCSFFNSLCELNTVLLLLTVCRHHISELTVVNRGYFRVHLMASKIWILPVPNSKV
jgi:hypothetical protein